MSEQLDGCCSVLLESLCCKHFIVLHLIEFSPQPLHGDVFCKYFVMFSEVLNLSLCIFFLSNTLNFRGQVSALLSVCLNI